MYLDFLFVNCNETSKYFDHNNSLHNDIFCDSPSKDLEALEDLEKCTAADMRNCVYDSKDPVVGTEVGIAEVVFV